MRAQYMIIICFLLLLLLPNISFAQEQLCCKFGIANSGIENFEKEIMSQEECKIKSTIRIVAIPEPISECRDVCCKFRSEEGIIARKITEFSCLNNGGSILYSEDCVAGESYDLETIYFGDVCCSIDYKDESIEDSIMSGIDCKEISKKQNVQKVTAHTDLSFCDNPVQKHNERRNTCLFNPSLFNSSKSDPLHPNIVFTLKLGEKIKINSKCYECKDPSFPSEIEEIECGENINLVEKIYPKYYSYDSYPAPEFSLISIGGIIILSLFSILIITKKRF